MVELVVAFAGGVLSLLSPCSALLLPAFFAYAFPSPTRLAARTAVFYAGMVTLLVPLGIGAGALGGALLAQRGPLMVLAGAVLIVIGVIQLVRGGFELPSAGGAATRPMTAERAASTYALGLGYGLGGFCAGPILGAVLTIAASSGGAVTGAVLLAAYAAGMAAPLLVLALAWERLGTGARGRLRGREIRILGVERHVTVVVSSVMFIALGLVFILLEGANPAAGLYAALGLDDLSTSLQSALAQSAAEVPLLTLAIVGLAVAGGAALVAWRLRARRTREHADTA
jgi:cytochrome c biogenesis protein CcdA